jgi:hypothetical protein
MIQRTIPAFHPRAHAFGTKDALRSVEQEACRAVFIAKNAISPWGPEQGVGNVRKMSQRRTSNSELFLILLLR